jgi:hypothetical protein
MRDQPVDFRRKKGTMVRIGASHIYRGKIHRRLVFALDETNGLFLADCDQKGEEKDQADWERVG